MPLPISTDSTPRSNPRELQLSGPQTEVNECRTPHYAISLIPMVEVLSVMQGVHIILKSKPVINKA